MARTHCNRDNQNAPRAAAGNSAQRQPENTSSLTFVDNRSEAATHQRTAGMMQNSHYHVAFKSRAGMINSTPPLLQQQVVQCEFDVSLDDSMIGKEVIVTTDEFAEHYYGRKGTIRRRSSKPGKWTLEFHDKPGELYRLSHDQLRLASSDATHKEVSAQDVPTPETSSYRLYKSKPQGGDWQRLELTKQADGRLVHVDGTAYRLLNIQFGNDVPFVSKEAEKQDALPTDQFVTFLEGFGFKMVGQGTIQDRVHNAVIRAQNEDFPTLKQHLSVPNNGKWYTDNIRQGGLNELILTSDSVAAVERAGEGNPKRDKTGWRAGKPYTFVELQRESSYPTKDFVFKETFDGEDGKYQNSHVNARMYYIDGAGKKHRTVGPVSPIYHLSMEEESLKFHFSERTTMKSLVYDLIELHKNFLATKSDILSVKANKRGPQVYEMRSGDLLRLNDPAHLAIFADIVQNHTNSVIENLKNIHRSLEDPENGALSPRPDLSPTHYPSVMSPGGFGDLDDY